MNPFNRLLEHVGSLRTIVGSMVRVGTVDEVKGDYLKMVFGMSGSGGKVLSPLLNTASHMLGGARERRFYKKGQNVMLLSPNGDPSQGMVFPWAPNKQFRPPDHANNSGQDEETYQLSDLRVRKTKGAYEIWIEPPLSNQQQQQSQSKEGDAMDQEMLEHKKRPGNGSKMKVWLDKDKNTVTGIVGKSRFTAHEKGSKIQHGNNFAEVDASGHWVNKEWKIRKQSTIPDYEHQT